MAEKSQGAALKEVAGASAALAPAAVASHPVSMSQTCHHELIARPSREEVARSLDLAEQRAADRGLQWTLPRRRVYELLLEAGGPVKAYDLMDLFSDGRSAKPPTVYRALEFLETQGLAHRIASINAFVACEVESPDHVPAFLICDCCGATEEFQPGPVRTAVNAARAHRFTPRAVSVEVRGRCERCGDGRS